MHAVAVYRKCGDPHVVLFKRFKKLFPRRLILAQYERVGVRFAGIAANAEFKLVHALCGEVGKALVQTVIAQNAADHTDFHTIPPYILSLITIFSRAERSAASMRRNTRRTSSFLIAHGDSPAQAAAKFL